MNYNNRGMPIANVQNEDQAVMSAETYINTVYFTPGMFLGLAYVAILQSTSKVIFFTHISSSVWGCSRRLNMGLIEIIYILNHR